eukprot:UN31089
MTFLSQKMKEGGYDTHFTGKWDVGMATLAHTPKERGYDTFLGYFHHANSYCGQRMAIFSTGVIDVCQNRFKDFWITNSTYDGPAVDLSGSKYEEELFTENSLNIIKNYNETSGKPLFLFHSFHLLHTPLQIPEDWRKNFTFMKVNGNSDYNRRQYSAMVQYMDNAVGLLMKSLHDKGIWDDTLVVFVSDNGGPVYTPGSANNHPLRGGKYSDWEGGVRVNAFVTGGHIPSAQRGKKLSNYVHVSDWYTTLSTMAGVDPTDTLSKNYNLPPVDGKDIWPNLSGSQTDNVRKEIYISNKTIIMDDFKLVTGYQPMTMWQGLQFPNNTCGASGVEYCPQPGFHSGMWLYCEDKDPACHSIDEHQEYPRPYRYLAKWLHNCSENGKTGCLYNIFDDPTEHKDLSSDPKYADRIKTMYNRLLDLRKTNFQPNRGEQTYDSCIQSARYSGFYGPWLDKDGKQLIENNSKNQPPPPCLCDRFAPNTKMNADLYCMHYPSMNQGFTCSNTNASGMCEIGSKGTPGCRGENPPKFAKNLCGKGTYSQAINTTCTGCAGPFLGNETVVTDIGESVLLRLP